MAGTQVAEGSVVMAATVVQGNRMKTRERGAMEEMVDTAAQEALVEAGLGVSRSVSSGLGGLAQLVMPTPSTTKVHRGLEPLVVLPISTTGNRG